MKPDELIDEADQEWLEDQRKGGVELWIGATLLACAFLAGVFTMMLLEALR